MGERPCYLCPIMGKNLFDKVFERHTVATLDSGQIQLFIGLHLIHEVTSPQAFSLLRQRGLKVGYPQRTFATVDHIIPTESQTRMRPLEDGLAEEMLVAIEKNTAEFGIPFSRHKRVTKGWCTLLAQNWASPNLVKP